MDSFLYPFRDLHPWNIQLNNNEKLKKVGSMEPDSFS